MTTIIERETPHHPEATDLLKRSHALMESLFNPEDNHFLSIDALCEEHIDFFVARVDGKILGCAALANQGAYGELKSMFVDEASRGKGLADLLMETIIASGVDMGLRSIKLETGNVLYAAHKVYQRHGFELCGPFGGYEDSEASVFMTKSLGEDR